MAILLGLHRAIRDFVALLKARFVIPLDYGYELYKIRLNFISEKSVNL